MFNRARLIVAFIGILAACAVPNPNERQTVERVVQPSGVGAKIVCTTPPPEVLTTELARTLHASVPKLGEIVKASLSYQVKAEPTLQSSQSEPVQVAK